MKKIDVIGINKLHFGSINSTNDYLKENNYLPSGTVVTSDYQTDGRGKQSNVWESARFQNIIMSILIKPDMLVSNITRLTKLTSVAIYKTLESIGIKSVVKWPNDVLVNGKKICGILLESSVTNNEIDYVIIGIGLNVNQVYFRHLTDIATSIKKENVDVQKEHIEETLIKYLNKYYLQFQKGEREYHEIYNKVKIK